MQNQLSNLQTRNSTIQILWRGRYRLRRPGWWCYAQRHRKWLWNQKWKAGLSICSPEGYRRLEKAEVDVLRYAHDNAAAGVPNAMGRKAQQNDQGDPIKRTPKPWNIPRGPAIYTARKVCLHFPPPRGNVHNNATVQTRRKAEQQQKKAQQKKTTRRLTRHIIFSKAKDTCISCKSFIFTL